MTAPAAPRIATIASIDLLAPGTSLFHLAPSAVGPPVRFAPGQFLQLSVPGIGEAPISICGSAGENLELCVRRAGHVTGYLHRLAAGDQLAIRGPFGSGFPVEEWNGKNILLLAGGLGIAPLRPLLHFILGRREEYGEIILMYGSREPSAILFKEELIALGARKDLRILLTVDLASEEPPAGLVCRTGLLPTLLQAVRFPVANTAVALCGPPPLYRCLLPELAGHGFPADSIYLSLERKMKCGVGHCCHCAVGEFFCCTDGPVFRYAEISHVQGAL